MISWSIGKLFLINRGEWDMDDGKTFNSNHNGSMQDPGNPGFSSFLFHLRWCSNCSLSMYIHWVKIRHWYHHSSVHCNYYLRACNSHYNEAEISILKPMFLNGIDILCYLPWTPPLTTKSLAFSYPDSLASVWTRGLKDLFPTKLSKRNRTQNQMRFENSGV